MRKLLVGLIVGATFVVYAAYFRGFSKTIGALGINPVSTNSDSTITTSLSNPSPTSTPTLTPTPTAPPSLAPTEAYRDGTYKGSVEDAFYGNIQVQISIGDGRITSVQFLQYPNDRDRSIEINTYAMPLLSRQAIDTQSANVDGVSGATDTSGAFVASLQTALSKAKA